MITLLLAVLSVLPLVFCGSPRALVIWHGLGDSYNSSGMAQFMDLVKEVHPEIFIHSVYIDENLDNDRKAGFYGNVNSQLEWVADQIASVPELQDGFDAMGFSQGGQFLRAYVERYNSPPVHNLITFGSQHMGISDIPPCRKYDFVCQMARKAAKGAVYSNWAQENIISAQYYRDPANLEAYLSANHFLPYVNNELPDARNETYRDHLTSLNNLVLVIFAEDKTVVPKESAWFGAEEVAVPDESENFAWFLSEYSQSIFGFDPVSWLYAVLVSKWFTEERLIVPMRQQALYKEDWIGLKELDERGAIAFESCKGEHMQMTDCWKPIVESFTGGLD